MSAVHPPTPAEWTVADLLARFGPILHTRIRQNPPPGTATEQDVLDIHDREDRLYELVAGVLVEKTMGIQESYLAVLIAGLILDHARRHDLGFALGADGMARLAPGLIRIPDVSFVAWEQLPERRVPNIPMLRFAPALAIEVLSPSNTPQEMAEKRADYFTAGVQLVWYVDPRKRTVEVMTAADRSVILREGDRLTGDPVLPGYAVAVSDFFAQLAD